MGFVRLFDLRTRFLRTLQRAPIFVSDRRFHARRAANDIFVVFRRIGSIANLFCVFSIQGCFLLLIFVGFTRRICNVIHIRVVRRALNGNLQEGGFRRFFPSIFIRFGRCIHYHFIIGRTMGRTNFLRTRIVTRFYGVHQIGVNRGYFSIFHIFLFCRTFSFICMFFICFRSYSYLVADRWSLVILGTYSA